MQLQNTPSLTHAGFAAFRGAVLLRGGIERGLLRHSRRAAAEVMTTGGFTPESGRLMQQLIDLQVRRPRPSARGPTSRGSSACRPAVLPTRQHIG